MQHARKHITKTRRPNTQTKRINKPERCFTSVRTELDRHERSRKRRAQHAARQLCYVLLGHTRIVNATDSRVALQMFSESARVVTLTLESNGERLHTSAQLVRFPNS